MTGYSAADLVRKSVRVLYASKEEFDRVGTLIYNQIQRSGTGSIETRWVKKDGMDIDVLLSSTPLDPANVSGGITITALDITERNKAGRALSESEDRYRKLVEISPDAVILHRDGKILYVNPASVRLLGAGNTEDLLGKNVLDFIQPEYRDAVRASIAKDLSGKATPPMELQMLRVNGTPVVVEGRGVSTSINGSPAVLVAINDITHRYQAGLALKKSEERYRTLAEASQDLIFLIGRDDRVEYVNSYAAAILGLPADQVIGGKRSVLFPGELGQRQARGLARVFETGKTGHSEGAMEINGALHWFDHYLMPIMNVHGTVTSVLGVSRDITDRKQTEQALQESGDQYRFIADNSLDIINRQTPDCICTYVSPAITPVLGYPETEVLGKSVLTMVHPDDLGMVQRDLMKIARNGLSHLTLTFRLRHRKGHYLWFESTIKIIRDEKTGQIREFLSISRDITARKSAGQETARK
jgi:PAS domain S-box-containing protein